MPRPGLDATAACAETTSHVRGRKGSRLARNIRGTPDPQYDVFLNQLQSVSLQLEGLHDAQCRVQDRIEELHKDVVLVQCALQVKPSLRKPMPCAESRSKVAVDLADDVDGPVDGPDSNASGAGTPTISNRVSNRVQAMTNSPAPAPLASDSSSERQSNAGVATATRSLSMQDQVLIRPNQAGFARTLHRAIVQSAASPSFSYVSVGLILINALFMGYTVQVVAINRLAKPPDWILNVQLAFSWIFLAEILWRMIALKTEFWAGTDAGWNVFDSVIVALSLTETMGEALTDGSHAALNAGFLRALRLMRIVRLVRVVRIFRFFRELRMIVISILSSSQYLLWAGVLLFCLTYISAIFLTQIVSEYRFENPDQELSGNLEEYFSTLPLSIYSLFLCVSGGISWGEVANPLIEVHWALGVIMSFYVSFIVFAVLNIITAAFVENANDAARTDLDNVSAVLIEKEREAIDTLKSMFTKTDSDESGSIEYIEFERLYKDDIAKAAFAALGLDVSELQRLFCLLDMDGSGTIDIEEFVQGCLRLKGEAKNFDLASLMYENKRIMTKWTRFMNFVTMQLGRLSEFEDIVLGPGQGDLPPGVDKKLLKRAQQHWELSGMADKSSGNAAAAALGRLSWEAAALSPGSTRMLLAKDYSKAF